MPWRSLIAGVAVTIALAILFRVTDLDLDLQTLAFSPAEPHWPYAQQQPWKLLHDAGTLPGLLLGLGSIAALTAGFLDPRRARWRYPAIYILLLTAIGPGLFTNIFGKILAGRPRPNEVAPFGGTVPFLEPFELGTPGQGFSFLCGHCSMGFLFVAFFFLWNGPKRWLALLFSMAFGVLLGMGRIVQAAHFPSDVLLGGSIMFTVAAGLAPVARRQPRVSGARSPRLVVAAAAGVTVVLVILFLLSTPIHTERTHTWLDETMRRAATYETLHRWAEPDAIAIDVDVGNVDIRYADQREPLVIRSVITGYGWPGADGRIHISRRDGTLVYEYRTELGTWEIHGHFDVIVRRGGPPVSAVTHDGIVRSSV